MVRIRAFEDQANQLDLTARMPGLTHIHSGEKSVGICEAPRITDKITATHRGHGHCFAKGADFRKMFRELLGKAEGHCGGKGGSMQIADQAHGNPGANAIVGGSAGSICARAEAMGIEAHRIDGQDMLAVNALATQLVQRARNGEGPFFIKLETCRYQGHHVGDINREYCRPRVAEEAWKTTRDTTVFLMGDDLAEAGHPFKFFADLVDEFGTHRVIDTPIAEPGFMGIAVGAAMTGMRPIVDLMFGDFLFLVMDQLCNPATKTHCMSGGKLKVPLVVHTNLGATRRSAAQHSQSLHALVAHIQGLKVALPSSAHEAKGLLKTAIRDESPVVILHDKMMCNEKAPVPQEDCLIPAGQAAVLRQGRDITLVGTSSMVGVCKAAAARRRTRTLCGPQTGPVPRPARPDPRLAQGPPSGRRAGP